MADNSSWQFDELRQVGKDYGRREEVEVYDSSHEQFRDVDAENRRVIELLDLSPDSVVIDYGAGTGAFASAVAESCRMVYAVDVSREMLAKAEIRSEAEGRVNVDFVHAGFLSYDHSGSKADAVTSSFSFHHLPDFWKGVALKRIGENLHPGGRLFIRDIVLQEGNPLAAITEFVERQERRGGAFLREDAEGHFREEFSTYDWVMRGLLERSGFRIESEVFSDGVIAEYLCRKE